MLKLVWTADHAGAPDSSDYKTARDSLWLQGGTAALQQIPKTRDGVVALDRPAQDEVDSFTAGLPAGTRAVVMVHGYDFEPDPDSEEDEVTAGDPYDRVFDTRQPAADADVGIGGYKRESWLNFVDADRAVGFGWTSSAGFFQYGRACWSNPYEYAVLDLAPDAAKTLAGLIVGLNQAGREVDVVAHSLGTRTTLRALDLLGRAGHKTAARRAILLSGAEFSLDAKRASRRVQTDVFNVLIRADPVLKWGASQVGSGLRPNNTMQSRVIGRDGVEPMDRWLDLRLDHDDGEDQAEFRAWFKARHLAPSAEPRHRGLHWTTYLNAGNQRMLRHILEDPSITVAQWLNEGVPDGAGWSRYGRALTGQPPRTPRTCRGRKAVYRN